MNIYDSIKLAAREGWMIDFDACRQKITIVTTLHGTVSEENWQNEHGLVTPVTALVRAIRAAKTNIARLREHSGVVSATAEAMTAE